MSRFLWFSVYSVNNTKYVRKAAVF